MNPGDRPRRHLARVLAVVATTGAMATLSVLVDSDQAGADELERFASCEALAEWGASDPPDMEGPAPDAATSLAAEDAGGGSGATATPAARTAATTTDDGAGDGDGDGTNVIVPGVDELDIVELLDATHALVSAGSRLSIIDLVDDQVVANIVVPNAAQITYDPANALAWVVGTSDATGQLTVTRVAVDGTSLTLGDSWSTTGWLVDARRIGDRLYVVAGDGYPHGGPTAQMSIPFADGPVPCDQVLHPVGDSDPAATLIVELPATGTLAPRHATEVVGSGSSIHVTSDAAYLATPLYGATTQTSFHRFDLATLTHTGSGRIDGTLLNEFAMSDHDGHLRVAVTENGGMRGVAIDAVPTDVVADGGFATTGSGAGAPADLALNEIVVFDTDGDLDVVGRTPRFGHPGETLQGIRFVGATAYAVTFLQTDPFYVVDLADPTQPAIVGDVDLPGFSSYLHPISPGLVAGFGPDDQGNIAVKLFDVSDPSRPTVVDELDLGHESPVAWDHHALVQIGEGRFAVPATDHREMWPTGCSPERQQALAEEEQRLARALEAAYAGSEPAGPDPARLRSIELDQARLYEEGCLYPASVPESSVVVVDTAGGQLELVRRLGSIRSSTSAERVVATDDGWALLVANHWHVIDDEGDQVADLELGPNDVAVPMDDVGVSPTVREG